MPPSSANALLEVVFTTSGTASPALQLTQYDDGDDTNSLPWRYLAVHSMIAGQESSFSVFRGNLDGRPIIVKMAEDEFVPQLCHEAEIYQKLQCIQGRAIPICHGLFFIKSTCALLLMEDCGERLASFSALCKLLRVQLISHISAIHERGVLHNDIEARNIVVSNNNLRIIDFGLAEDGHQCDGMQKCPYLRDILEHIEFESLG